MSQTRRLAAILAADVAGYSRLMGTDEEGTHERLKSHLRELVEPKLGEHRGRTVKNTGDGFLAEFPSVVDAVRCAVEVQRGMADRELGVREEQRIRFRIGVNLGDVIVEEHDIFGDGVNVAARLEALAEPGGICLSRMVRDNVRDKLDFAFEDMGEKSVKKHCPATAGLCGAPQTCHRSGDSNGAARCITLPARRCATSVDRCSALHEPQRRSGAAIFRRWNNRGPDDRSVADFGHVRDLTEQRFHL